MGLGLSPLPHAPPQTERPPPGWAAKTENPGESRDKETPAVTSLEPKSLSCLISPATASPARGGWRPRQANCPCLRPASALASASQRSEIHVPIGCGHGCYGFLSAPDPENQVLHSGAGEKGGWQPARPRELHLCVSVPGIIILMLPIPILTHLTRPG